MRDDAERLRDVLEAIERIEKYTAQGRENFNNDELVQTWVVHHIQIIGEAVRNLSDVLRASHPELPWVQIIGMRNILIHEYFGIDADEVWTTVVRDLPDLRHKIKSILRDLDKPPTES